MERGRTYVNRHTPHLREHLSRLGIRILHTNSAKGEGEPATHCKLKPRENLRAGLLRLTKVSYQPNEALCEAKDFPQAAGPPAEVVIATFTTLTSEAQFVHLSRESNVLTPGNRDNMPEAEGASQHKRQRMQDCAHASICSFRGARCMAHSLLTA